MTDSFLLYSACTSIKDYYTTCMLDAYQARRCALSGILLDLLIFEVPENKPQYEANTLSILVKSH